MKTYRRVLLTNRLTFGVCVLAALANAACRDAPFAALALAGVVLNAWSLAAVIETRWAFTLRKLAAQDAEMLALCGELVDAAEKADTYARLEFMVEDR